MALDFQSCGSDINDILQKDIDKDHKERMGRDAFSKQAGNRYYDYAMEGEADGVLVSAGGTSSLLEKAFFGMNSHQAIQQMATQICSYWNTVVTPGQPVALDVVVSVVPAAMPLQPAMVNAIHGYIKSGGSRNGWPGLIEVIEGVVNQIPYTVTEVQTSTGVTTSYVSYVS